MWHSAAQISLPASATLGLLLLLLLLVADLGQHTAAAAATFSEASLPMFAEGQATYCSFNIAAEARCPAARPVCCVHLSAVRCCPLNENAGCACAEEANTPVEGYELSHGTAILGMMSGCLMLMMGCIMTSSLGRHCAWQLERHRVIKEYRARQALRRQEAAAYKRELEETEVADLPESEACVICCARLLDCALVPCGHVCSCRFCAKRLKECPVCRGTVELCYRLPNYLTRQLAAKNSVSGTSNGDAPTAADHATAPHADDGREDENVIALSEVPRPREGPPAWAVRHAVGERDAPTHIEVIARVVDAAAVDGEGAADELVEMDARNTPTPALEEVGAAPTRPGSHVSTALSAVLTRSRRHPHAYSPLATLPDSDEEKQAQAYRNDDSVVDR